MKEAKKKKFVMCMNFALHPELKETWTPIYSPRLTKAQIKKLIKNIAEIIKNFPAPPPKKNR